MASVTDASGTDALGTDAFRFFTYQRYISYTNINNTKLTLEGPLAEDSWRFRGIVRRKIKDQPVTFCDTSRLVSRFNCSNKPATRAARSIEDIPV